jgi:hypothetical protein
VLCRKKNQIAFGQELRTTQHRKTACILESVQNTHEEKFKGMGKDDVFHTSECAKRNDQEYRHSKVPFHGAADNTYRAEIPQSA